MYIPQISKSIAIITDIHDISKPPLYYLHKSRNINFYASHALKSKMASRSFYRIHKGAKYSSLTIEDKIK